MGVTHVVRGKDHLTNTPKQIQIYRALGLPEPRFGHLPLILGLSKRLRSAGIETYRAQGYLAAAINNYIVRLGWSHGDQELFSGAELVEKFDLADVNRSEGSLNLEKMEWINQQHIIGSEPDDLAELVAPHFDELGVTPDPARLAAACETVRQRAKNLVELAEKARFYFVPDAELGYDAKAVSKFLDGEAKQRLAGLADALAALDGWNREAIEQAVRGYCEAAGIKLKHVAQPARVALTGSGVGPGLFETIEVLGRQSTLNRVRRAVEIG
jgi:glutamyl-tRNA synthetase